MLEYFFDLLDFVLLEDAERLLRDLEVSRNENSLLFKLPRLEAHCFLSLEQLLRLACSDEETLPSDFSHFRRGLRLWRWQEFRHITVLGYM